MIIPLPQYRDEPDAESVAGRSPSVAWVKWYLSAPNWSCPSCQAVMFGRMKYCVYCKVRLAIHTPRPENYQESLWTG